MTSGGARLRAGRPPDPDSARSDRRKLTFRELPTEGYAGPVPDFPLESPTRRELELWADLWALPQGHVWSQPGHQWRHGTLAMYVRQFVRCEATDVGAAHVAQLHRFADQLGLTDAGLAAMGWTTGRGLREAAAPASRSRRPSSRDRIGIAREVAAGE